MPYTLKFSDTSKNENIIVPDMPPGVNNIDTSLSLIGKNYPNYGEKISQNFLSLLENFASPLPPENPIEGQLWYDTSDPNNKVLRVMDGTADSSRWPAVNGIYQQGSDPRNVAVPGLRVGDIWVDTQNNLLKIYHSGEWTTVGPSISSGEDKTGAEPAQIESTTGTIHNALINYVNGNAVAVITAESFIPKTVIDGFGFLNKGINIPIRDGSVLNGTADMAYNLRIGDYKYSSERIFIKDGIAPQIITANVFFQTPVNQNGSQGRDGVVIDFNPITNNSYVQLYKFENDAVLLNNTNGGKLIFKTKSNVGNNLISSLIVEGNSVAINTVTNTNYALNVNGNVAISGNLVLSSTASNVLSIAGSLSIAKNLTVQKTLTVQENVTISNVLTVGSSIASGFVILPSTHDTQDIGSAARYFKSLYVSSIGSASSGTTLYGNVIGNARGLFYSSEFKLQGQVTATSFIFSGTGTQATFNTSLTPTAITSQPAISTITSSLTLLTIDTSTSAVYKGLGRVSRNDFIQGIVPVGSILPYGGFAAPAGWRLCNGDVEAVIDLPELFSVIGFTYGGGGLAFNLPDMRYSTTSTVGFINYIIKI